MLTRLASLVAAVCFGALTSATASSVVVTATADHAAAALVDLLSFDICDLILSREQLLSLQYSAMRLGSDAEVTGP